MISMFITAQVSTDCSLFPPKTYATRDLVLTFEGTLRAFLSGKLSYAFKFSGPSIVVDTACSSSTVAIYQACTALKNGDCSSALAGGVNSITSADVSVYWLRYA